MLPDQIINILLITIFGLGSLILLILWLRKLIQYHNTKRNK